MTDEQLMEQLRQGQTGALDELYRRYARQLYVFCRSATRSPSPPDAEDLVQDVFMRVIKAADTFDPQKASFRTWLFRIARNRCIDVMRRRRLIAMIPLGQSAGSADGEEKHALEDVIADEREDVEEIVVESAVVQAVRDCIAGLGNQDERQAIVLYYLGGKVYREIGEIMGKSTSMARNRVRSAQEQVKQCLERKGILSAF